MSYIRSITFGQMYRHEAHPTYPLANPDGWLVIEAPDQTLYEGVRNALFLKADGFLQYAFDYPGDQPASPELYHRGEIERIIVTRITKEQSNEQPA